MNPEATSVTTGNSWEKSVQVRVFRALDRVRPAPLSVLLKRVLRIKRVVVDTADGKFWLDPVSNLAAAIFETGSYEPSMQRTLVEFLGPGKVFVDLGANEGYFAIHGARLTEPDGQVISVEPQNRLIPVLQRNIWLNGAKNVRVVHAAISDRRGTARLHLAPEINTGSTSVYRTTKYLVPTQTVKTIPLSDLLDEHHVASVDLMKVDIEGAEYEAILGSPTLFERHRIKAIALELHPVVLAKHRKWASDIERFLDKAGYRKTNRFGNDIWLSRATS